MKARAKRAPLCRAKQGHESLSRAGSGSRLLGLRAEEAGSRIRDRLDDERCRIDLTRRDRDRHFVVAPHRNPAGVRSADCQKRLARTVDRDLGFADRRLVA
jgi:hypothetical protein